MKIRDFLLFFACLAIPAVCSAVTLPLPTMIEGFEVELIHEVDADTQGSWVSMTVDNKGRLITSDQRGKLYRTTLGADGQPASVEQLQVESGSAHGLLYAFDSLYVMMNAGDDSGLYRLRDTTGDDQFDRVELLLPLKGSGEHGPHAIILSPDGRSLVFCAGNHTKPPKFESSRLPQNWDEDLLLPRMWDAGGHAVGILAPGGIICRIDPDGKNCELLSAGYRNEFDIAFGPGGGLFTFDADMEWDVGLPWYRPTRILHATSGSEFGWRSGTGKWPSYYPDSLPSVVDIGPGSPSGITFGYGAKFPPRYQQALFAADWSYGILFAVHLEPDGSSFRGTKEVFATGQPFPITDVVVHPHDGAMYVTTGGRNCQSGLFRIRYTGSDSVATVDPPAASKDMNTRRGLESLHTSAAESSAVDRLWPFLSSPDRFTRYAARIALEHQPPKIWKDRALQEGNIDAKIECSLALARTRATDSPQEILATFQDVDIPSLTMERQLGLLRCCGLVFSRLGQPEESLRDGVLVRLDPMFPASDPRLNRELCQLLIYLKAPNIVQRTLDTLRDSVTQHDRIFYLLNLRVPDLEWTLDQRRAYLQWTSVAMAGFGGHSYPKFVQNILDEFVETLSPEELAALEPNIESARKPGPAVNVEQREAKHEWSIDAILAAVEQGDSGRDLERGKKMFAVAQCFKCHRFRGSGGIVGPDLTAVGGRYGNRDLVTSILDPAKTISDQYQMTNFQLHSGKVVTGRVVNLGDDTYQVAVDLLQPDGLVKVPAKEIESMSLSTISSMPTGLMNVLELDEILDLIAYLRSKPE